MAFKINTRVNPAKGVTPNDLGEGDTCKCNQGVLWIKTDENGMCNLDTGEIISLDCWYDNDHGAIIEVDIHISDVTEKE